MVMMAAVLGAVLGVASAEYVNCDLASCTCAGVSLQQFEKGGPYTLRDASKPTTTCALPCDSLLAWIG